MTRVFVAAMATSTGINLERKEIWLIWSSSGEMYTIGERYLICVSQILNMTRSPGEKNS